MTTRAEAKMEEQMAVLMARIDERLLDLARQQTEQLQGFRTEMGERQTTLKQELREELLHELATSPGVRVFTCGDVIQSLP